MLFPIQNIREVRSLYSDMHRRRALIHVLDAAVTPRPLDCGLYRLLLLIPECEQLVL